MSRWPPSPVLVGGGGGFIAAYAIGHWLEATFNLRPWVTGGWVCETYGSYASCFGYPPAGVVLLALPLVMAGSLAGVKVSQYRDEIIEVANLILDILWLAPAMTVALMLLLAKELRRLVK